MSKNHRLVEYFLSEFYLKKPEELEHIISPTFTFIVSTKTKRNFAQYIEQVWLYTDNANVVINSIQSQNDRDFMVNFSLEIVNNTVKYGNLVSDRVIISVKDDLIQEARVVYDASQDEFNKFKAIL